MMISLVVAHGKNREIGFQNKLLWHIPEDLKNFKKITMGKTMVMGRKTFESIGKLLPGRETWILSNSKNFYVPGATVFRDKESLLAFAQEKLKRDDELLIVGGEMIYRLFLPESKRVYLTTVDFEGEADAFFPVLGPDWHLADGPNFLSSKAQYSVLERSL